MGVFLLEEERSRKQEETDIKEAMGKRKQGKSMEAMGGKRKSIGRGRKRKTIGSRTYDLIPKNRTYELRPKNHIKNINNEY